MYGGNGMREVYGDQNTNAHVLLKAVRTYMTDDEKPLQRLYLRNIVQLLKSVDRYNYCLEMLKNIQRKLF